MFFLLVLHQSPLAVDYRAVEEHIHILAEAESLDKMAVEDNTILHRVESLEQASPVHNRLYYIGLTSI
jgi:hypothetical protein